jgi:tetratricopeptide (TPR) repeat protein
VARLLTLLAIPASALGDWELARRVTAEATAGWDRQADFDRFGLLDRPRRADELNALGLLHFTAGRPGALRQASDAFSAACHLIEGNPWYHLNLSYAYAGMGEWIEAAEAIEQLFQCEPEWFRSPVLQARLAEYRLRRGDELAADKRWDAATEAYRTVRASPGAAVPADLAAAAAKRLGDTLVQLGRLEEAGREYRAALTTASTQLEMEDQAALQARLAFLAGFRGEFLAAADLLGEALVMRDTLDDPRPADVVVADATEPIRSIEQYRRVSETLRLVSDRLKLSADERWELARARLELADAKGRELLHPVARARPRASTRRPR